MRKKILITLAVMMMALSLVSAASAATYGYIAYQMSDIWNEYSSKAFKYAAEKNGVDVVILDSQNDIGKSVAAMESLIQQEVDGISIFPISPEQGAQLIKMANEAKIPITVENIDVAGVAKPEEYVAAVGCLYGDIGYAAIEWLSKNVENAKVFYCAGAVGGGVFETYKIGVDKALEDYKGFHRDGGPDERGRLVHGKRPEPDHQLHQLRRGVQLHLRQQRPDRPGLLSGAAGGGPQLSGRLHRRFP